MSSSATIILLYTHVVMQMAIWDPQRTYKVANAFYHAY